VADVLVWSARFIIVKIGLPLPSRAWSTRTLSSIAAACSVVGSRREPAWNLLPSGRRAAGLDLPQGRRPAAVAAATAALAI